MQKRLFLLVALCACGPSYDVIIRNGTIYDGKGGAPIAGDLAIVADSIVAVGTVIGSGKTEIDAMLSWSTEFLLEDGLSQSEIRQGVTLQVMGEGYGPGKK